MLGCSATQTTLFSFPINPLLRQRWLEFIHFEDSGILASSRLCARHFHQDSLDNHMAVRLGYNTRLLLRENAVPSVYTVGASTPVRVSTFTSLQIMFTCYY